MPSRYPLSIRMIVLPVHPYREAGWNRLIVDAAQHVRRASLPPCYWNMQLHSIILLLSIRFPFRLPKAASLI